MTNHGPVPPPQEAFAAGATPYKEAGATARLVLDRARRAQINGTDWRVLSVVIELTATYSKLYDKTYVARIAQFAGLDRTDPTYRRTKRSLKKLSDLDLIVYEPGRRNGQMSLFGLAGARHETSDAAGAES